MVSCIIVVVVLLAYMIVMIFMLHVALCCLALHMDSCHVGPIYMLEFCMSCRIMPSLHHVVVAFILELQV